MCHRNVRHLSSDYTALYSRRFNFSGGGNFHLGSFEKVSLHFSVRNQFPFFNRKLVETLVKSNCQMPEVWKNLTNFTICTIYPSSVKVRNSKKCERGITSKSLSSPSWAMHFGRGQPTFHRTRFPNRCHHLLGKYTQRIPSTASKYWRLSTKPHGVTHGTPLPSSLPLLE
jgi:hypothetical protein